MVQSISQVSLATHGEGKRLPRPRLDSRNGVAFTINQRAERLNVTFQKSGSRRRTWCATMVALVNPCTHCHVLLLFGLLPLYSSERRTRLKSPTMSSKDFWDTAVPVYASLLCQIIVQGTPCDLNHQIAVAAALSFPAGTAPVGVPLVSCCEMPSTPRGINHQGRGLTSGPDRKSGKVML